MRTGKTDGQTQIDMTELIVAFRNFANARKNRHITHTAECLGF
jgi:hypothetical protein